MTSSNTFDRLEALSNQKVIVTKPIEKMKVPLIVLCVFLILLELLTAGLRASSLGIQYEMNMTIIVVYAVVSLALLIFYTTVAIKVLIRIHNSESRKLRLRTVIIHPTLCKRY
jgi:predicted membrane protein